MKYERIPENRRREIELYFIRFVINKTSSYFPIGNYTIIKHSDHRISRELSVRI